MRPDIESLEVTEDTAVQWAERVRLFRDSFWNIASLAVAGVTGLVLVPVVLGGLGAERYGLWLAASAVLDMASGLGFGLGLLLVREVAGSASAATAECERLVRTSRLAYLLLGVAVLLAMVMAAGTFAGGLHLSMAAQGTVRPVFLLLGIAFVGEQLSAFALAVLAGLRRFDLIGMTAITTTIANAAVTYALLRTGHSIVAIAYLRAALAMVTAAGTSVLVFVVRPELGRWTGRVDLRVFRGRMEFLLASQANTLIGKAVFDGITPVIGFVLGSQAIVPYRIGLKFPQFLTAASGRVAEVLFPASSEYEESGEAGKQRDVLQWSTRLLAFINLPVSALLFVVAPQLLHLWVPTAPPETATVLRVYVFAVFLDALGFAADNMLWGTGEARKLLGIVSVAGAVTFAVGIAAMTRIGVAGMAVGTAAGFAVGTACLLALASKKFGMGWGGLLRFLAQGLAIPAALCVASVWEICRVRPPAHLYTLAGITVLGMAVYLGAFLAMEAWRGELDQWKQVLRRRGKEA